MALDETDKAMLFWGLFEIFYNIVFPFEINDTFVSTLLLHNEHSSVLALGGDVENGHLMELVDSSRCQFVSWGIECQCSNTLIV